MSRDMSQYGEQLTKYQGFIKLLNSDPKKLNVIGVEFFIGLLQFTCNLMQFTVKEVAHVDRLNKLNSQYLSQMAVKDRDLKKAMYTNLITQLQSELTKLGPEE